MLIRFTDGVHFVTATTAPRMQVGNEFHVWDYTGKQTYLWKAEKHLFGIIPFRSEPPPDFPDQKLETFIKAQGNKPVAASMRMILTFNYVELRIIENNFTTFINRNRREKGIRICSSV